MLFAATVIVAIIRASIKTIFFMVACGFWVLCILVFYFVDLFCKDTTYFAFSVTFSCRGCRNVLNYELWGHLMGLPIRFFAPSFFR